MATFEPSQDALHQAMRIVRMPFNPGFWSAVAGEILGLEELAGWVVLVPSVALAAALRAGFAARVGAGETGRATLRLPRILTLEEWLRSVDAELLLARSPTQRRVELFSALKGTAWLTRRLGAVGAQFWGLARQLLEVCDEITLGLGGKGPASDGSSNEARLLAALRGRYTERAWQVCSEEAELVLGIWRGTLGRDDGAALFLRGLERLARLAPQPLCVIAPLDLEPHVEAFLARYAENQELVRIEVDVAGSLAAAPALALAWPELVADSAPPSESAEPLIRRAATLCATGRAAAHIRLFAENSLEDEAACAAQKVLEWLAEGRRSIGLVTQDRLVARRVRALLERADVLVRDEAGWKFSTSTVAGTLMRWLELVHRDETQVEAAVLLDWLKSPHVLTGQAAKEAVVAEIEVAVRRDNVVRGWSRIAAALERARARHAAAGQDDLDPVQTPGAEAGRAWAQERALEVLAVLRAAAVPLAGRHSLGAHFNWLHERLQTTQMADSFRADPVGWALLEHLAGLARDVQRVSAGAGFAFAEWRDFVADALESATFREQAIDSPVVATSLAGAAHRHFDALVVLGADAAHLPARAPDALFVNAALRAELGLADQAALQRRELTMLALLLAATPSAVVTWRGTVDRHPNAAAGAFLRLMMLHQAAFGTDLIHRWEWPRTAHAWHATERPAPAAPELVPPRLTASAYNLLIGCPYRYFVRHMLGLEPLEALREDAEKRDYGEIVHRILERYHERTGAPVERAAAIDLLRSVSAEVFTETVGNNPAFLGYEARWSTVIEPYVDWWQDWTARGWRFERSEWALERALEFPGGRELVLAGRLDRVDRSASRVAILDYKARSPGALRAGLKEPGEDVQLPFYRVLAADVDEVEACYLSVDRDEVRAIGPATDLDQLAGLLLERIGEDFRRLHAGWGLPANGAESVCAHCDARGLCRKGQWLESASSAGGSPP